MGKILIVEDDPDCFFLLEKVLTHASYEVAVAKTGKEALDVSDYNLALIDISLPDMDGFELVKQLKEKHPNPILILSAHVAQDLQNKAKELGCVEYLVKPVLPAKLIEIVQKYV